MHPLAKEAVEVLSRADLVLLSHTLLDLARSHLPEGVPADRLQTYRKLGEALELLSRALEEGRSVAFLASGDPLFFGVGRRLIATFGPERVRIFPAVSSLQLALARLKIPWEEVFAISLHGPPGPSRRYLPEDIPALLRRYPKLAILTDPRHNPQVIAEVVKDLPALRMLVCERLGYPDEALWEGSPEEALQRDFRSPNLVVLLAPEAPETPVFGWRKEDFVREAGLITKDEVRAVVLHKLRLPERGVLWDIGAGSGAVACEAACLAPHLSVYAVEKIPERRALIEKNRRHLGVANLRVIAGEAPEVLRELPDPHRVFIGGSGGRLSEILEVVYQRIQKGPLVLTLVLLEHLREALSFLKERGMFREMVSMQIARTRELSGGLHLRGENPVFIVVGEKR